MGVSGGVVAYQVAFAIFLVPYAVLALPMITAVLPELAGHALGESMDDFGRSLRWALDSMVGLVVPVSVGAVVFGPRAMEALAFGQTSNSGGRLIGAAVAALGLGLLPYAAFLLFVRAYYALGEGRTPAVAALVSAAAGGVLMAAAGLPVDGSARLAVMGGAHSLAYLGGAWYLAAGLQRRIGRPLVPPGLVRSTAAAVVVGAGAALALAAIDPTGRTAALATIALLSAAGGAAYAVLARRPLPRRLVTR
jgi:putative peptidoglycan lipid II flippase